MGKPNIIECLWCGYCGPGYKINFPAGWESYCYKHVREVLRQHFLPYEASRMIDTIDREWRTFNNG